MLCDWWNAYLQLLVIIYHIMNNYFTTSRLLTHHGVRNIQAIGVLKKNRLCKCTIIMGKQPQKNGLWQFWASHIKQKKKKSENLTAVGWNNNRMVYIASSKSSKPKILVWHLNKTGRTIFKNNNEINSTVTTRK